MSLLCQIEMTLPGGFAELAYEPSVLKRARSNNGSGFVGWCIGRRASAALRRGSAPARRPTPTIVTSLSGGHTVPDRTGCAAIRAPGRGFFSSRSPLQTAYGWGKHLAHGALPSWA